MMSVESTKIQENDGSVKGEKPFKFVFRFEIDNVSKIKEDEVMYSPPCVVHNLAWRIMIRKSIKSEKAKLGFFLDCQPVSKKTSDSWSCYATAKLKILDVKDKSKNYSREIKHSFNADDNDWGWKSFYDWDELCSSDFVIADSVLFQVSIIADQPKSLDIDNTEEEVGGENIPMEMKNLKNNFDSFCSNLQAEIRDLKNMLNESFRAQLLMKPRNGTNDGQDATKVVNNGKIAENHKSKNTKIESVAEETIGTAAEDDQVVFVDKSTNPDDDGADSNVSFEIISKELLEDALGFCTIEDIEEMSAKTDSVVDADGGHLANENDEPCETKVGIAGKAMAYLTGIFKTADNGGVENAATEVPANAKEACGETKADLTDLDSTPSDKTCPSGGDNSNPGSVMNPEDDQACLTKKKRKSQTTFTQDQIDMMEKTFECTHYPSVLKREALASKTNLLDVTIQHWFSDRRKKWRHEEILRSLKRNSTVSAPVSMSADTVNSPITPVPSTQSADRIRNSQLELKQASEPN